MYGEWWETVLVSEAQIMMMMMRKAGEPDGSERTSAFRARGLLHRGFINQDLVSEKFNRKKVPYSDDSSDVRKPNWHGSVLRPSNS